MYTTFQPAELYNECSVLILKITILIHEHLSNDCVACTTSNPLLIEHLKVYSINSSLTDIDGQVELYNILCLLI